MRGKKVDKNLVIKMYKSGLSMSDVGRRLGHDHSVIAYHIKKSGIKIRPSWEYAIKDVDSEKIIDMYNGGMSLREVSEIVGLTDQGVYERLKKSGVKTRTISESLKLAHKLGKTKNVSGKNNWNWKGGRHKNKYGYITINIGNNRKRPEHRMVWEKHNGEIPEGWVVHHLNGIRDDNRIENLCAMPRKYHSPKLIIEPYKKRIKELELTIAKLEKELK